MYRSGAAAQRLLALTPLVQTGILSIASLDKTAGLDLSRPSLYREVCLMAQSEFSDPGGLEFGLSAENVRCPASSSRGRPPGVLSLRELRDLRGGDVRGLVL